MSEPAPQHPFPALTPAQRVHLDVFGYVVVEKTLTDTQTATLRDTLYAIEEAYRTGGALPEHVDALFSRTSEYFRIDNLPHVAPCFLDYLTHPHLVGMAEEAIGGAARLEQSDAHIRRPPHDRAAQEYAFHRGGYPGLGYVENGLYHFPFVKTLTNLTDLGPADGGTAVIPGSHKLAHVDDNAIIDAAMHDPALIHQVIAPAGSTLLFFESLLHSSGLIMSDSDRLLIIGGYTPTMFQAWEGYDPNPAFVETLPEQQRRLLDGSARWDWHRRFRRLEFPASDRTS